MFDAAVTVATATVWRLLPPAAGGQIVISRLSIHGLRAGPLSSFYDQGGSPGRLPLLLRPQYTSSDSLSNYALTRVSGSQAGLPLLFFSPSAAAFFRGTPDPTLGFPSRPAGRPGPGPGPSPLQPGDVPGFFRSGDAWWRGPGRAVPGPGSRLGTRAGPRPGPARARGFRRLAGTAVAGLRPYRPHPLGRYAVFLSVLACVLFRRRRAALWEPCCAAWLLLRRALGPSFYSEQWCWPGRSPGCRLRRRPELPCVIKLSHLVSSGLLFFPTPPEPSLYGCARAPPPSLFGCMAWAG